MKKPIDPNLNDNFDIDINFDIDVSNEAEVHTEPLPADNSSYKSNGDELFLSIKNPSTEHHHHHTHSEHHHSSDGEHHHSTSSSHHTSSGGHHTSSHGHSSSKKRKKKKNKMPIAAKIAIVFLIFILFIIFAVVGTFIFLEQRGKSDITSVKTQTNYEEVIEHNGHKYVYNDDVVSIAFLGIDKRTLGADTTIGTAGQADAVIVLTVDTSTGKSKAIAVPRDTMVDVDLYSENDIFLRTENMQLCLSYAYGNGTDTSAQNVTTSLSRVLYNIPINKYFALDLDGIAPINDAIGGVTVESLYDFDNLGIYKGDTIHLKGDMTETYVRQRDMDTVDASLNRTARQVQYIKAFAAQAFPAVVNDFSIISKLYNTAAQYSSTDLEISNVTYLASLILSKGIRDFETTTIQGKMIESDRTDYNEHVYAEFYPDEESTLQTVLDTFYTQVD